MTKDQMLEALNSILVLIQETQDYELKEQLTKKALKLLEMLGV